MTSSCHIYFIICVTFHDFTLQLGKYHLFQRSKLLLVNCMIPRPACMEVEWGRDSY